MSEETKKTNVETKEEGQITEPKNVANKTTKDSKTEELKTLPIDERSEVKDISMREQNIKVTETDGTTIDVNIKSPGMRGLEDIDSQRYLMTADGRGRDALRLTSADLHEALFTLFTTPIVNGDVASEKISWDFFEKHERATYNFLMETADTFLTNLS